MGNLTEVQQLEEEKSLARQKMRDSGSSTRRIKRKMKQFNKRIKQAEEDAKIRATKLVSLLLAKENKK